MGQETVAKLFELSIAAERMMQDCYAGLAKKFSHMPKVSHFWKDLAKDEVRHIVELENARASIPSEGLSSTADQSMIERIKKVLEFSAEDMLKSTQNLNDAYELVHEMEYSEINAIFKSLTTNFIDSSGHQGFIVSLLDSHLKKLMDFSRNFGDAEWRKTVMVRMT